jgi:acyl-CoA synthetase (AMP-forming)/AMP-acid ligase II
MESSLPQTIGAILERNATRFGDQVALFDDQSSLTHRALFDRAARIGAALTERGVGHQDRVAFLMPNGIELICLYSAAELSGFIAVPLNWRLAPAEVLRMVNDCRPRAIVFDPRFAELAEQIVRSPEGPTVSISATEAFDFAEQLDECVAAARPSQNPVRATPDDIAYLIYTSGSSGQPKGVMLDQKGQLAANRISAVEMRLSASDRTLITMPLFHIGAKLYQAASNLCGAPAYMAERYDPRQCLEIIQQHRITVMPLVPTMVESLVCHPDVESFDLSSLRMILYTGAAMPGKVLRRGLQLLGPRFLQMYGQTEGLGGTTLHPHHHAVEGADRDRILASVGQAGMLSSVKTVDEKGDITAPGVPGEIFLKSEASMRGYWNNSVATAETLQDGWVRTGDIGVFDRNGFLSIVGRRKEMIISGGENIFAGEVEEAIMLHPGVMQIAVIGVPDERWGEAVKAIIVQQPGYNLTSEEIIKHCAKHIASYKKPRHVEFASELPKNPVGKVDKKALKAQLCSTVNNNSHAA